HGGAVQAGGGPIPGRGLRDDFRRPRGHGPVPGRLGPIPGLFEPRREAVPPGAGHRQPRHHRRPWRGHVSERVRSPEERSKRDRAYSVRYGNTLVLVLDCTEPLEPQTPWIEEQLANTDATWKFVVFHFPPYSPDEDYPDIRAEWCTVFDKYHVDFVLAGHVHNYQRTHPIRNGEPMERPEQGTVYLITCSVPWRPQREKPEYAAFVGEWSKPTFVALTIDGDRLEARAFDEEGNMHDEFTLVKQAEPALA